MNNDQQKILAIARSLIGTPYKYAVPSEEIPKFLDCSSFTQYAYQQIGIEIPRSTILQAAQAGAKIELTIPTPEGVGTPTETSELTTKLEIGDLLFFRGHQGHYNDKLFPKKEIYIGHVAMYTGDKKIIHGSFKQGEIVEENLDTVTEKMGPIVMAKRLL